MIKSILQMEENQYRSFLAIKIPEFHKDVNELIRSISENMEVKLKIIDPKLYHFTLHFFGNIYDSEIEKVISLMDEVELTPFELSIEGTGSFPKNKMNKTRVLYLDVKDGYEEIIQLSSQIRSSLDKTGFKVENRPYSPHLTVSRIRYGKNLSHLAKQWRELELGELIKYKVESFELMQSTLTPQGPIYNVLKKFT